MHALIFDIAGTLTETNPVDTECFVEVVEAGLGVSGIDTDWNQYPDVSDQGIVEKAGSFALLQEQEFQSLVLSKRFVSGNQSVTARHRERCQVGIHPELGRGGFATSQRGPNRLQSFGLRRKTDPVIRQKLLVGDPGLRSGQRAIAIGCKHRLGRQQA